MHRVSEKSAWWEFTWSFPKKMAATIQDFIAGTYRFSPLKSYTFSSKHNEEETIVTWDYADRLILHLLWKIIKPVAMHLIPSRSYYFHGGPRRCLQEVGKVLQQKTFSYAMRLDIKGFYASIDRKILLDMLLQHFQDPRLRNYFEQIVNVPIDRNAEITNPAKGIPMRSTLSPFFGSLYLLPLLLALQRIPGVECFLFMDDLLVLIPTRKQYRRAKKILFQTLATLKLRLSPKKSKMGPLESFHFLGIAFHVSRNRENKIQLDVQLHQRTCTRAIDRVKVLAEDSVNPETRQHYLVLWGRWWSAIFRPLAFHTTLVQYVIYCISLNDHSSASLGRGLLPWRLADYGSVFGGRVDLSPR